MTRTAIGHGCIAAILILNSFLGGCASTPDAQAARPAIAPPAEPRNTLNVMTVNLEHRDRPHELEVVSQNLRADPASVPDFILCQEVVFNRWAKENSTAEVLAKFMGYDVRGTKRTSDHEGIAILSKYPIDYYDSITLKSQTSPLLLGFRRVSTMAETTVPGIGKVRLVNVHLTNWRFESHVRRAQIRETLDWAARREREVPAAITFLAGDFNAERSDSAMNLVRDHGVTAPLAFHDWNGNTPSHDSNRRIDHIFISTKNHVTLSGENLLWKEGVPDRGTRFVLSDHLPVVHHYDFAAPSAEGPTATIRE